MRSVDGPRPATGSARRGARWARGVVAVAMATVPLSTLAQTLNPYYDRATPYGMPTTRTGEYATQGNSSSTQQNNAVVDPNSSTTAQPYQPVEIEGADLLATPNTLAQQQQYLLQQQQDRASAQRVKRPAEPNEFEKYIETVTGRQLPRFGSNLLLPSDRDYAVPAQSTIPADYVLGVGDTITISLAGSTDGSVSRQIDRDGKIFLPRVGAIRLNGVRYGDLRQVISNAVGRQYRGYTVTASVRELRGIRVYVTGFANDPGTYSVNSLSTMANAVLAAGGPASGGSFRSVKLYRQGRLVSDFDLYDFLRRGDQSQNATLQNEDMLVIMPLGQQVAITGSVNEEAIYELKPGESVADLLRFAGGTNELADASRVILYRTADRNDTGGRELAAAELPGVPLRGGDLIQVLSEGSIRRSVSRQQALVRIEGEVNKPGNYLVPPNTTVGEIMAMAGGVTPRAYVYGTRLERVSVRRQQREAFRQAIEQFELQLAAAPISADQALDAGERTTQRAAAQSVLERLKEADPDGRIVLDLPPEAAALPASVLIENNDTIVIPARASTVGVFGAVFRPASFLFNDGTPKRVRDYVEQAGGPIRAADRGALFVVRANGSVLTKRRGALNARVLPGDVIFMPIKTQSTSVWARIREITTIVSQIGFTAAALAVLDR